MTMVGEDDDMAKKARVLNRIVRWHPKRESPVRLTPGKLLATGQRMRRRRRSTSSRHVYKGQDMLKLVRDTGRGCSESSRSRIGAAVQVNPRSSRDDVGDYQRHVMGDASAAIGIFRRTGFGKDEALKHKLVAGPREGRVASICSVTKQKSRDNSADLSTKALDHDSIKRHKESMGNDFP